MAREAARRARQAAMAAMGVGIRVDQLVHGDVLGHGSFGKVRVVSVPGTHATAAEDVHHNPGKKLRRRSKEMLPFDQAESARSEEQAFALKTILKSRVVDAKEVEHLLSERAILACLDHPFLPYLVASWQTARELCLLQELILGGELFSRVHAIGKLDVPSARFYAGCCVEALTYLHDLDIVHRDVKQENLLIDEHGYLKLIDFGFAKVLENGHTYTFCGTPDYLAPEIIAGTGHGKPVDWWALGILLYEMLAGKAPFVADDPMDTYHRIAHAEVAFPWFGFDAAAKSVIGALLTKDSDSRLGSLQSGNRKGPRQVRSHAFFEAIDFVKLEHRELAAPFVPTIAHKTDASNYEPDSEDESDEEEEDDEEEDEEDEEEELDEESLVQLGAPRKPSPTPPTAARQSLWELWDTLGK